MITQQTRLESNLKLDRQTRYKQILELLETFPGGLTAREIADKLGYVERNSTSPRLTELEETAIVKKQYDLAREDIVEYKEYLKFTTIVGDKKSSDSFENDTRL